MKHSREDYNRIQDPAGLIPEDEPVFLLRGQDPIAANIMRIYAILAYDTGCDSEVINTINSHAFRMDEWRKNLTKAIHPADL